MKQHISPLEQYKYVELELPDGGSVEGREVLLHACCAPCSAAIVECMLRCRMRPTVFFSNANIFPLDEYSLRKHELMCFLDAQGVPFVDDDYDHASWREAVKGLEHEPERGRRCSVCFEFRLRRAASYAATHGFTLLATTLTSSRWKDIDQINEAGQRATMSTPSVTFWAQNWRRGGLQVRRGVLLKENNFYNQQYCGCEFSRQWLQEKRERKAHESLESKI